MNYIDLLKEAAYYDSLGKHKLADNILTKIARDFNPQDLTYGGAQFTQLYVTFFNNFMNAHPQCQACPGLNHANSMAVTPDEQDYIAAHGNNYQQAAQDFKEISGQAMQAVDINTNGNICEQCLQALRGMVPGNDPAAQKWVQDLGRQIGMGA